VVTEGSHPLQIILSFWIRELSFRKWGVRDFTWMFNACQNIQTEGSGVWINMIKAWNGASRCTTLQELVQGKDISGLPIWTPSVIHLDARETGCKTPAQRAIRQAGFNRFGDVLQDGVVMTWEDLQANRLARRHKTTFCKLCSNLQVPVVQEGSHKEGPTFVAPDPLSSTGWIWEYKLEGEEIRDKWSQGQLLGIPNQVFQLVSGRLMPLQEKVRPEGRVQRVLVGKTKGCGKDKSLFLVGTLDTDQGEADRHCWKDGRPIFESSTGHLRRLIAKVPVEEHVSIQK
jgi:hypothetical protein